MRNRANAALVKGRIRQSWTKYNLYNLSRFRSPPTQTRTFFQQKWAAKSIARAYHGEQVGERKWKRMFSKRIRSVIPLSPAELAQDDGSIISAGRGSGLQKKGQKPESTRFMPFTHMAFAPLERRLDVAIFRALFASSARQARQFVIHGAVTVNGQKMRHPGYLLNPGDLFQVDPVRVMYATGAPKNKYERREARQSRKEQVEEEGEENAAESESKETEAKSEEKGDPRETLKALMGQAKNILSTEVLPAKRKQELRGFQKAVRRVLSRSEASSVLTDNLESQFSELTLLLRAKRAERGSKDAEKTEKGPKSRSAQDEDSAVAAAESDEAPVGEKLSEAFQKAAQGDEVDTSELTDEEFEVLKRALTQTRDNPVDNTKPYATPWRPRDYMSAFAFIPRYLEVNQNICAAVYLRHPVVRPGVAEVPTPFGEQIATPAYGWYLRRRW